MATERYSVGWTDPRGVFASATQALAKRYGDERINKRGGLLMAMKKEDAHEYITEAKGMPIEACVSMWVIKYGDGQIPALETVEQDTLMWEIGNRLWWANRLQHNKPEDTYEIID